MLGNLALLGNEIIARPARGFSCAASTSLLRDGSSSYALYSAPDPVNSSMPDQDCHRRTEPTRRRTLSTNGRRLPHRRSGEIGEQRIQTHQIACLALPSYWSLWPDPNMPVLLCSEPNRTTATVKLQPEVPLSHQKARSCAMQPI